MVIFLNILRIFRVFKFTSLIYRIFYAASDIVFRLQFNYRKRSGIKRCRILCGFTSLSRTSRPDVKLAVRNKRRAYLERESRFPIADSSHDLPWTMQS